MILRKTSSHHKNIRISEKFKYFHFHNDIIALHDLTRRFHTQFAVNNLYYKCGVSVLKMDKKGKKFKQMTIWGMEGV